MFQQHERIAEIYRRQFQFILVDEYQDTNKIQADLVDLLARDHQQPDGGRATTRNRFTPGAARTSKTFSNFRSAIRMRRCSRSK